MTANDQPPRLIDTFSLYSREQLLANWSQKAAKSEIQEQEVVWRGNIKVRKFKICEDVLVVKSNNFSEVMIAC